MRRAAFTLVELLMVVLIVGIVASVAIPTYAGSRDSAKEAAAREKLEIALRAARAQLTLNDGTYPADLPARVADGTPEFTVNAGTGFAAASVQVDVPAGFNDQRVVLRTRAANGTNVQIVDDRNSGQQQTSRITGFRADTTGLSTVTNLVRNPSFENGAASTWSGTAGGGGFVGVQSVVQSPDCRDGNYCAQVTGTGTGTSYFAALSSNAAGASAVPASPGDVVAARCSVRQTAGTPVAMNLFARSWNGAADYGNNSLQANATAARMGTGEWVDLYGVGTITLDPTTRVALRLQSSATINGPATFQWDRCMMIVNPPLPRVPAFFDGRNGGGAWTGTPDQSESVGPFAQLAGPDWQTR